MEKEKLMHQSFKTSSLSETKMEPLTLGNYKLPQSDDLSSFLKEAAPVLGQYMGKGMEIAQSGISPDSPYGKEEFGEKLMKEIYPRIGEANSVKEIEPLLKDLYIAFPKSKSVIEEVRTTFGQGGGGVMAIPPVVVVGVIAYCVGYVIGHTQTK